MSVSYVIPYEDYNTFRQQHPDVTIPDIPSGWTPPQPQPALPDAQQTQQTGFNIPLNVYPRSSSTSSSKSSSWSGINWNTPLIAALVPTLRQQALGLPQLAQDIADTSYQRYRNALRMALGPEAFQGTLNQLVSRGILGSSVASNALARAGASLLSSIADKLYQSQMAAQAARMKVPSILGDIVGLGRESKSSGSSASSSTSENPLAPYQLMAQLLMSG